MKQRIVTVLIGTLFFCLATVPLVSQDEAGSPDLGLGMDLALGTSTFTNPSTGQQENWQTLGLKPDLAIGKFGIGLDITLNYRFTTSEGEPGFEVRKEDWVPSEEAGTTFLDLYLPLFNYIRWGVKGEPLYAKIGGIEDGLLGNGFILGGFSNTLHRPDNRLVGLSFDLDGNLFGFPYVGLETFVSNLAAFDLMGGRFYTRPLAWLNVPVLNTMQLGFTLVADRDPFFFDRLDYKEVAAASETAPTYRYPDYQDYVESKENLPDPASMWGFDLRVPILGSQAISLAAFTDLVKQPSGTGFMIGFGGQAFSLLNFGAQVRVLGENFLPVYFDGNYDLYRVDKYRILTGEETVPGYEGWFATLGLDVLEGMVVFNASLEGPFKPDPDVLFLNPTLKGHLSVSPELLAGFSLNGHYEKKGITDIADLISPENAVIGLSVGYQTGPAIISLVYDLKYNPVTAEGADPWKVTSSIETTLTF
ncbi:hypothetical protein [Spirochaeta lutea]|uniref:DUF5723 domain-containing protein n=1 Tax=Spirochaeta lutea TaxID=1480694 RepID=A0A098QVE8_9SPIO|nr:hypothetical protein [Spirochaeta lutea]KGE71348.1 hypothetical protein DC28_11085 [Spirochaeta lutea]